MGHSVGIKIDASDDQFYGMDGCSKHRFRLLVKCEIKFGEGPSTGLTVDKLFGAPEEGAANEPLTTTVEQSAAEQRNRSVHHDRRGENEAGEHHSIRSRVKRSTMSGCRAPGEGMDGPGGDGGDHWRPQKRRREQEEPPGMGEEAEKRTCNEGNRVPLSVIQPTAGPSQPIAGPSRPIAGPSRPIAGPSQPIAGPSRPIAGPSQPIAGPSRPTAGPSQAPFDATLASFFAELGLPQRAAGAEGMEGGRGPRQGVPPMEQLPELICDENSSNEASDDSGIEGNDGPSRPARDPAAPRRARPGHWLTKRMARRVSPRDCGCEAAGLPKCGFKELFLAQRRVVKALLRKLFTYMAHRERLPPHPPASSFRAYASPPAAHQNQPRGQPRPPGQSPDNMDTTPFFLVVEPDAAAPCTRQHQERSPPRGETARREGPPVRPGLLPQQGQMTAGVGAAPPAPAEGEEVPPHSTPQDPADAQASP